MIETPDESQQSSFTPIPLETNVFDPNEAINIVEQNFELNPFIEISKRQKTVPKYMITYRQLYKKEQMKKKKINPDVFKSIANVGKKVRLRWFVSREPNDPIRIYLYNAESWRNNEEAFGYFKQEKEDKIRKFIEKYKNDNNVSLVDNSDSIEEKVLKHQLVKKLKLKQKKKKK